MNTEIERIENAFVKNDWFEYDGLYVLFDGQFGSTGKGLLASVIAEAVGHKIDMVATNAGPNSGHTAFSPLDGEKVMTQQIPVASVMMAKESIAHTCYLNGGAVIEPGILYNEADRWANDFMELVVHPHAALIRPGHQGDHHSDISSTGKGVGPAMMAKLSRHKDMVISGEHISDVHADLEELLNYEQISPHGEGRVFVETAQGYGLGINAGFYPYCTSRECSVAQAVADMGASPKALKKSIVSLRAHPIRVGNHPDGGYSGDVYPDQKEISFEDLGVEPELTTVTQRVRRVFTWSWTQFAEMLRANEPDALFINFVNYLPEEERDDFVINLKSSYRDVLGRYPDFILGGFGPMNTDVKLLWERP